VTFTAHTPNGKVRVVIAVGRPDQRLQPSCGDWSGAGAGLSNDAIENGIRNLENVSGASNESTSGSPFW